MSLRVQILEGPRAGETIDLGADTFFIGSGPECEIHLADLAFWHGRVTRDGEHLLVENFDEAGRTHVGPGAGVPVTEPVQVRPGTPIRVGGSRLVVGIVAALDPLAATMLLDDPGAAPPDPTATVMDPGPAAPPDPTATVMDPGPAAPADPASTIFEDPAALPASVVVDQGAAGAQGRRSSLPAAAAGRVVSARAGQASADRLRDVKPSEIVVLDVPAGEAVPVLGPALANRARLELSVGDATRHILIGEGGLTLGADGCDVTLPDAPPGTQAAVAPHPAGFFELQHLAGPGRPVLNGEPIRYSAQLVHGDRIQIGRGGLRFVGQGHDPLARAARAVLQPGDAVAMSQAHDPTRTFVVEPEMDGAFEQDLAADLQSRPRLRCVAGPAEGREVLLGTEGITIGRDAQATVTLDDGLVGAAHCAVSLAGPGLFQVEPLDAGRPTLVNDDRVEGPRPLAHGDLVTVGASTFEFLAAGLADADPIATVAMTESRFLLPTEVIVQQQIVIGSDPAADVVLEDPEVEGRHAAIVYNPVEHGFRVKDLSRSGLWIGAHRVVDQRLDDQDVIRIGPFGVAVVIDGFNCALDISAERAPIAPPRMVESVGAASPFSTLFRLPSPGEVPDDEVKPAVHRPKRSRTAPKWKPPRDVRRDWRPLVAVLVLGLGSAALAWSLVSRPDGAALADRPVSTAHASPTFAAAAAHLGNDVSCGACHTAGARPAPAQCTTCHQGQAEGLSLSSQGHAKAELGCVGCHIEHPEGVAPPGLMAPQKCAGCHPGAGEPLRAGVTEAQRRHVHLAAIDPQRPARPAPAGTKFRAGMPSDARHRAHIGLEGACFACHTPGKPPSETVAAARSACMTCHGGQQALAVACGSCHEEHPPGPALLLAGGTQIDPSTAPTKPGPVPPPVLMVLLLVGVPLFGVFGLTGAVNFGRGWLEARKPEPEPAAPPPKRKKVIHINVTRCVACSSCIDVCPFEVLHLGNKKVEPDIGTAFEKLIATVKDFDRCQQCGVCETECPTMALTRAYGPPRLIKMPEIDRHYHSNVEGLYLAGAVAGIHLVKNAANIGHRCVKHAQAHGLVPGGGPIAGMKTYDVAIVGAGPAGLSAAATCEHEGLEHVLLEKGDSFASMLHLAYPSDKLIELHPRGVKHISHLWLPEADSVTWPELQAHWGPAFQRDTATRTVKLQTEVTGVEKRDDGFVVTTKTGTFAARRVIIAIGVNSTPRPLGVEGSDLPKVRTALVNAAEFEGKRCMIIGAGNSAVEAAITLAEAGAADVGLSVRGDKLGRVSAGNVKRLDDACAASGGRLTIHYLSGSGGIAQSEIVMRYKEGAFLQVGGPEDKRPQPAGEVSLANDAVFSMIGFIQPLPWLQKLGINIVERTDEWDAGPTDGAMDGGAA